MTVDKGIDPARVGISKSLMTTPCSRQGYFKERVRDESGRRLNFPMPERVTFGNAIDAATAYIVGQERDGAGWTQENALTIAMIAAIEKSPESWLLVEDQDTFEVQVQNAITLYVTQPEGLAKMRERIGPSLRIQGNNGESLRVEDVVGTPDFYDDLGVVDVKSTGSAKGYGRDYLPSKFYEKAEMPVYSWLWAAGHDGQIPERMAYHVYVRQAKPHWQWIEVPGSSALIELGQRQATRWRKGLLADDPDLFDVDLSYCGECPYREAIPEANHPGCPTGQARVEAEAA